MKKIVLVGLLLAISFSAFAQEKDSITIKRLDKLEKIMAYLPKISGLVDFRYQYSPDISSFDVRRARLDVRGDIGKMFDYRLQVEFASTPKILDAYARVKIKPYFNIQGGSFKTPLSIENQYSPKNLEFIDNALVISKLTGYSDISGIRANGRDVGLMFYGGFLGKRGFNMIEYSIGIYNGAGINVADNNKSKDIAGRLDIHPIKALTLSASAYIGENFINNNHKHARRDRYAFGIKYDDSKFTFRSEYINGLTGTYTNNERGLLRSHGAYGVFGYTIIKKITPAIRVDYFQNDIHNKETTQINYAVGCSYWINRFFRCQVNYTYQTFGNPDKAGSSLVSAMVTATF